MKSLHEVRKFIGTEDVDVEQWIDRFESAVANDGMEAKEAVCLAMRLDSTAYDTCKRLYEADRKQVDTIKAA